MNKGKSGHIITLYIFFTSTNPTCFETDRTPLLVLLEAINEVMLSDDSAHFVFLFLL